MCELNGTKCEPCKHEYLEFGVDNKNNIQTVCAQCKEEVA